MKKLYWLIDGALIWSSSYLSDEEAIARATQTQDLSDGKFWLVQADVEPDFPKATGYKHLESNN